MIEPLQMYPKNTVVRQPEFSPLHAALIDIVPNIYVTIAVDVAYVVGQAGQHISNGIYMMDNSTVTGSLNQGGMMLSTVGRPAQIVAWNIVPINPSIINQSLEITFIQICLGEVFGSPPQKISGKGFSWLAQLMHAGTQTYAIQIKVTEGLNPVSYFVNWEAQIIAK